MAKRRRRSSNVSSNLLSHNGQNTEQIKEKEKGNEEVKEKEKVKEKEEMKEKEQVKEKEQIKEKEQDELLLYSDQYKVRYAKRKKAQGWISISIQHAQHVLGHKMLKVRQNESGAFHWFRKSADQGHAHSAYNLAAGHLSGFRTDVKKGEVRELLKFAAKNGVEEAKNLLRTLCRDKPKYCDIT